MTKHPDCVPCGCGMGDEHCKHAHLPWFELTDDEKAILDLEARQFTKPGAKEAVIVEGLGVSAVRYWQIVNALIDQPAAQKYAPLLCRRLQRLRDARVAARAAR